MPPLPSLAGGDAAADDGVARSAVRPGRRSGRAGGQPAATAAAAAAAQRSSRPLRTSPQELQAARAALTAQRFDESVGILRDVAAKAGDTTPGIEAQIVLAHVYARQRLVDEAVAAYAAVVARYPTHPKAAEAMYYQAQAILGTRRGDRDSEAHKLLTRDRRPLRRPRRSCRGRCWRGARSRRGARTTGSTTVLGKAVPASLVTYRALTELRTGGREREHALWRLGQAYERVERFDLAAQAYRDLGEDYAQHALRRLGVRGPDLRPPPERSGAGARRVPARPGDLARLQGRPEVRPLGQLAAPSAWPGPWLAAPNRAPACSGAGRIARFGPRWPIWQRGHRVHSMPKLVLLFEGRVLKETAVSHTAAVTIGRLPDNTIVIDNSAVSSHHARIAREGPQFVVEDLESTNGTFVNGEKITKRALRHGDTILVGKHKLFFDRMGEAEFEGARPARPRHAGLRRHRDPRRRPAAAAPRRRPGPHPGADRRPPGRRRRAGRDACGRAGSARPRPPAVGRLHVLSGRSDLVGIPPRRLDGGDRHATATRSSGCTAGSSRASRSRSRGWARATSRRRSPARRWSTASGCSSRRGLVHGDVLQISGLELEFRLSA